MKPSEKLAALRAQMARRGISAYVVVTDDFHGSEYVGDYFKARAWLSGFTGSAGTLLVLPETAALWTDGRYFLQAGQQLEHSGITLMKSGQPGVPELETYLAEHLPENGVVGFDGRTVSNSFAAELAAAIAPGHGSFVWDTDLVDEIWTDRPALSREPVWALDAAYTGQSREARLAALREKMAAKSADVLVLTALDEIAWLLNLRGDDVACTPVFLAYMLVERDKAVLCLHQEILSPALTEELAAAGVQTAAYNDIYALLGALPGDSRVMLDGGTANYRITQSLPGTVTLLNGESPVIAMKAVKTSTEQENMRLAHIRDGVAVTRFIRWMQETVGRETVTELSAAEKLEEFRGQMPGYLGPSFTPILGYGPHGAIIHYSATAETDAVLEPHGFCLADTGGQYRQGTTDITRTVPLGELTREEKEVYTRVLRGHLALGEARFLYGCCGADLDILARTPLWEAGMDYNHGTGHGVGFVLSVHEGPQRIHWRITGKSAPAVLEPGMVISNEPGYYAPGKFGVRHENLVLVQETETNADGRFLALEPLTMVPFDTRAVLTELMSDREIGWLNAYHARVFAALSPCMEDEELSWLAERTAPIGR